MPDVDMSDEAPTVPAQQKARDFMKNPLKACLPRAGMKFSVERSVTANTRKDLAICKAINELGLPLKRREVQTLLKEFINLGTQVAATFPQPQDRPTDSEAVDNSKDVAQFFWKLRKHPECQLGPQSQSHVSRQGFTELFSAIVRARQRFLEEHPDRAERPQGISHMSKAVDEFLETAWFWNEPALKILEEQKRARDERIRQEKEAKRAADIYYERYKKPYKKKNRKVHGGGVVKSRGKANKKEDKDVKAAGVERGLKAMEVEKK